ncbi:hypothetical protein P7C70_g5000, partial [Phenoliferia sp. Uapishka_3]
MPSPLIPLVSLVVKTLGIPAVLIWQLQRRTSISLNTLQSFIFYVLGVSFYLWSQVTISQWRCDKRAKAVGATPIPRVRGKWLWNFDILVEGRRRFSHEMPGTFLMELEKKCGTTFDTAVLGGHFITTIDPLVVKHALTGTSFLNYEKGSFFNKIFEDLLGSGQRASFQTALARLKRVTSHRNLTRPYFAAEKISDFDTFSRHTARLLQVIDSLACSPGTSSAHSNGAVEIQDLFGRFTLDSATDFLMSGPLDSLSEVVATGDPNGPSTAFLGGRGRLGPLWPLFELWKNPNEDYMAIIAPVVEGLINKALAKPHEVNRTGDEAGSLLDSLIHKTRDSKIIKDQVLNILLAARDTTMSALTFSTYSLARDPVITAKLRAEILSVVGKDGIPTYEEARGMKYLRAFINEVLRMFPPVPFNIRAAIADDVVEDSDGRRHFVAGGTRVSNEELGFIPLETEFTFQQLSYSLYNMQRRIDLWGEDALTFDPDRWLDERKEIFKANPFIFQVPLYLIGRTSRLFY